MGKMLNCRFHRPSAGYRLVCFPWAGGGSNFYAGWGKLISDNIEVVGITLAGRESRFGEACCFSLEDTLTELTQAVLSQCADKPLIFWGHSMGALLAFETALRVKKTVGTEPIKMYLSGVSAPHSPMRKRFNIDSSMSDVQFIDFLRRLGGTPAQVLDNEEMMKIFLPCLRADYTLLDCLNYQVPVGPPPLTCPIAFFDGDKDVKHDTDGWKMLTSGHFTMTMLPGGHFYLREKSNMMTLIKTISADFSDEHEVV